MAALIVYYSRTGSTRIVATALARGTGGMLRELVDVSPRSNLFLSAMAALFHRRAHLVDPDYDVASYDTVVLMTPVWAGNPTPAFNAFVQNARLAGKRVTIVALGRSGQGVAASSRLEQMVRARGGRVQGVYHIHGLTGKEGLARSATTEKLQAEGERIAELLRRPRDEEGGAGNGHPEPDAGPIAHG